MGPYMVIIEGRGYPVPREEACTDRFGYFRPGRGRGFGAAVGSVEEIGLLVFYFRNTVHIW